MSSPLFFLVLALVFLVAVVALLRSRKLREKYAALWIVVTVLVVVLAIFPDLLEYLARAVGIAIPSNLLFALALLLLLGVTLHLSLEVSRLDDETRVLSEEVGILRLQVHDLAAQQAQLRVHAPAAADEPATPRTVEDVAFADTGEVPLPDLSTDEGEGRSPQDGPVPETVRRDAR